MIVLRSGGRRGIAPPGRSDDPIPAVINPTVVSAFGGLFGHSRSSSPRPNTTPPSVSRVGALYVGKSSRWAAPDPSRRASPAFPDHHDHHTRYAGRLFHAAKRP